MQHHNPHITTVNTKAFWCLGCVQIDVYRGTQEKKLGLPEQSDKQKKRKRTIDYTMGISTQKYIKNTQPKDGL